MWLLCRECGEELTVAEDTGLAYLAWEWTQEISEKSNQTTPPDEFVIANHPHGIGSLEVKATGKPWPLVDVGGGIIGLAR